ncbi:MAG: hypothetical protein V2I39_08575 [Erythrobacter sp.]|nr:hypothetical protein [Erythrobacter sp.]
MAEVSPIDALPRPLGVAVHDAGAANMIAAWVAAASAPPERIVAAGPARAIWQARFGEGVAMSEDPQALAGMASVLSGTGWASDLEHAARLVAARSGARSVAVVDHWVNYAARFERGGAVQLPDAIWVGDPAAQGLARATFPGTPVECHANLYLAQQAAAAGPVPEDGDILFLLEPARSDWGRGEPGEFQALDHFCALRDRAGVPPSAPLRLRPHPSDLPGKYDAWLERHPEAVLDTAPDMGGALRPARWVAGMNSAGLAVALAAGRSVIGALPPHAPPCVLPHAGIMHLARL